MWADWIGCSRRDGSRQTKVRAHLGLRPHAAGEDSRCGSPFSFRFSFPLSESALPLSSRCRRACGLFFPSLVLNPASGKLGARISPARADSPDSPRAHLSRAPTRFHPRASLVKSPRGARLAENRRHARLGDDSGRHTHKIHGALDAAIFFSTWTTRRRLVDALKTMMKAQFI